MLIHATTTLSLALALAGMPPGPGTTIEEFPPQLEAARPSSAEQNRAKTPPSVRARRQADGTWSCHFVFSPPRPARSVSLAGDFNGWNSKATSMVEGENGTWAVEIAVPEGTRYYKFVVDGNQWFDDPRNPDHVNDGHGGRNSLLRLGTEATLTTDRATRGDGLIEAAALKHDPNRPLYFQALSNGQRLLRYRTLRGDLELVGVVLESGHSAPMKLQGSNDRFDFWEAVLPPELPDSRYTFILTDGDNRVRDPEIYTLDSDTAATVHTPDWAKDAIWYQIMVDRFRNGTDQNDPDPVRPWRSEWYSASPWEGRDGQTFYEWFVFDRLYGGDLQGLNEKLDYLAELGVNAIYLNPVFQAVGSHKYNTTNYIHVDEHYGVGNDYAAAEASEDLLDPSTWTWTESDRMLLEFIRTAKGRGFRVILDGVFNHVGTQHPAFRDVLDKGKESAYADWFEVTSWDPFEYEGWAGFGSLPVFRKSEDGIASETAKKHIMDVTRRWMDPDGDGDPSDGIDGWRLDVPNEVAIPFWVEWCAHVRSINPDAYITGEIWDRADEWLDGRTFDAVMNYEFSKVAFEWIADKEKKISPTEADRQLAELRLAYPTEVTYVLQNLIDSHDTDRAVSKIHNPDRAYDSGNREQNDPTYDGSKPPEDAYRRLQLMALFQMTYVGAPMVYYGDEVGMWGSDDPNNRKPMLWQDLEPYESAEDKVSPEQLAYYKDVIALRRNHPALSRGSFHTEFTDDTQDVWAYVRADETEEILVALNAGDQGATIELPEGDWQPIFPDEDTATPIVIERLSGRVWRRAK